MKLKHEPIDIPEGNPFENCKLNRKPYAEILTNVVNRGGEGFVLSVNNEWGTGKTTFAKMWKQHLVNQGLTTLYLNVWEGDFNNDALAAIMAELALLQDTQTKDLFKNVLKTGAKLTKGAIPLILKGIAAKYIDKEVLKDLLDGVIDNSEDLLNAQIKDYTAKKEGLKEFKDALIKFLKKTGNNKPVVFIIDELDRCRPDYAVEVLEKVKHFFDVPGIVFALCIDKVQLGHAVRGVYGSEQIDASGYLKRFIDLEYSLPKPSMDNWVDYLYDYLDFNQFIFNSNRRKYKELNSEDVDLKKFAAALFENKSLTLRDVERVLSHARLALSAFNFNDYLLPSTFVFLIYLRSYNNDIYTKIRDKKYGIQELVDALESTLTKNIVEIKHNMFLYLEACIILFYNNSLRARAENNLISEDSEGKLKLSFNSKFDYSYKNGLLATNINSIQKGYERYDRLEINHFIDKIDLTIPFIDSNS